MRSESAAVRRDRFWLWRHLGVGAAALAVMYLFRESRAEWSPMHAWNRALGDASLVLLAGAMSIGPLARIWPAAARLLPWRREIGIWAVVYGVAHTLVILDGWVEWDLPRLFGFLRHPLTGGYVMVQHGFGLGNALGVLALVYGTVLALTSNNLSQRLLGGSTWKFLQLSTYTLWMLSVTHTAFFLFMNFLDFHRPIPAPNWLQAPFAVLVLAVLALQTWAFWVTWRRRTKRGLAA